MKDSVYIIIPAYNEGRIIFQTLENLVRLGHSIVIVDDGSTDNTKEAARQFPVHYLRHSINLGQGAALRTGIDYALKKGADIFVTFDADGQHDFNDVNPMIEYLKDNKLNIVFGSRFLKGASTNVSTGRKITLNFARFVNFALTGLLMSDAHNGFRVFDKIAAAKFKIVENGMAHASELLYLTKKHKLLYTEFPVNIIYTEYSKQKGSKFIHSFKILQDIFLFKFFK